MSAESKKPSCQQLIVPRFITKPPKRHFSRNAAVLSMSRPKASSLLTSVNNLAQHYRQKPKLVALLLSVYTTLQLCLPFGCDMECFSHQNKEALPRHNFAQPSLAEERGGCIHVVVVP